VDNKGKVTEIACLDAVGRSRVARVFPAALGHVAIQAPPGEVMVLTIAQLHALWIAAREECRNSSDGPDPAVDADKPEPHLSAGNAA
jgi:hypothetical protein